MHRVVKISQYELERGKPLPSVLHSHVQGRLMVAFGHLEERYNIFSELDLELGGWKSVPDLVVFPKAPIDFSHDELVVKEPPLGVVLIDTIGHSLNDLISATRKYLLCGVSSSWLILPSLKNVYIFSSPENYQMFRADQNLVDSVLGIELELSKIFV